MSKCVNISPSMRRSLFIYDFATAPLWLFMGESFKNYFPCSFHNILRTAQCQNIALCLVWL